MRWYYLQEPAQVIHGGKRPKNPVRSLFRAAILISCKKQSTSIYNGFLPAHRNKWDDNQVSEAVLNSFRLKGFFSTGQLRYPY